MGLKTIVVNDPEGVRHVLTANASNYRRPPVITRFARPLGGSGLFLAEAAEWRRQRRLLAPTFSPGGIGLLLPHFRDAGLHLLLSLQKSPRANLAKAFQDTALEAVLRALFSMPQSGDRETLSHMVREHVDGPGRPNLFDGLAKSEDSFAFANRKRARFQKRWFATIDQIISQRKASPTKAGYRDLLDLMLRLTDAETGEALSDAEIRDQCSTMFFAGSETTARLMFRASYLLAMDPEEQASVRKEIAAFPPERISGLDVSGPGGGCAMCFWRPCGSIRRLPISFGPQMDPTSFAARKLKRTRKYISAHGSCIAIGDSGIGRPRFFLVDSREKQPRGRKRPLMFRLARGRAFASAFHSHCRKPRLSWRSCCRATGSACPTRGRSCPSAVSRSSRLTNRCFVWRLSKNRGRLLPHNPPVSGTLQFDRDAVGVLEKILPDVASGNGPEAGVGDAEPVETAQHIVQAVDGEGDVVHRVVEVCRGFARLVEMHRRPCAVIEPGAGKAESGPETLREPERLGVEGDAALKVVGADVHVMDMNGHVRLLMRASRR
jgi:hypothetical protein